MPTPPDPRRDTRAILHPGQMRQWVTLERFPVPSQWAGILDWAWSVTWVVPAGESFAQDVLSLPAVNVSVGTTPPPGPNPPPGPYAVAPRVVGVASRRTTRVLSGSGWNVAVKTTVGGFGAFVNGSVAQWTDAEVPMEHVLPVDSAALADAMALASTGAERADLLVGALEPLLAQADQARIRTAREVAAIADVAAADQGVRRVGELAAYAGVSVRTLQRLFAEYAGISPAWMLRRLRLVEAAERVARGEQVRWADVAGDLGYSDQAHLSREFTAAVGATPSQYAAAQGRPRASSPER